MARSRATTGDGVLTRLPPALRPLWPVAKRTYTRLTAAASYATGPVSQWFGGELPVTTARSVDELSAREPCVVVEVVRPAETVVRVPPPAIDARNPTFEARSPIERCAVARLPRGRVLGPRSRGHQRRGRAGP